MKMRTFFKKIVSSVAVVVTIFSFGAYTARAGTGTSPFIDFSGIVTAFIPCTCTPGFVYLWVFNPDPTQGAGPLVWAPTTILHDNFLIIPGASLLGNYIPGVQSCWMYAGFGCFPLPVLGQIYEVGTGIQALP